MFLANFYQLTSFYFQFSEVPFPSFDLKIQINGIMLLQFQIILFQRFSLFNNLQLLKQLMFGNQFRGKQKLSTVTFKKSPVKYEIFESTYHANAGSRQIENQNSLNVLNSPKYSTLKKIPDEYASLRQTFDYKNNSKLQSKLADYNFESDKDSKCADTMLRQTFHTRKTTNFLTENSLCASVAYKTTFPCEQNQKPQKKLTRVPKSQKHIELDGKFRDYIDTLQKYKDQLETTSKMGDQLQKLKEDRRKRLQAKQLNSYKKTEASQYQKYKTKEQLFSPTYYKQSIHKNLTSSHELQKSSKKFQIPFPSKSYELRQNIKNRPRPVTSKQISVPQVYKAPTKLSLKDFVLGKNLGEGKFGQVYQAIHKKTGFLFALKKIPKQMIKSHLMIDQFILELKLQTFLNHANILSIFTHFDDNEFIYLVLQYMEQGTLFSHLKKHKKLPEKDVAVNIKQVSLAIEYMQQNAIAHRDIKPQNVVMSHGVCKLCDFGWATICSDRRKTYCGTFDYAPPQILEGVQYDYTVDLWCLGVLTYELLVGKAPFYHISRKETMKKIINVQNTTIQYPKNLSSSTISFIDHLLKKNPDERMTVSQLLSHPFLKDVKD